jgi:uncharacterized membrane protein YhhN
MHNTLLIFSATVLLAVLLTYEHKEDRRGVLATKTALSLLFVLAAIAQPHPNSGYYHRLLPGLLLCLGGDVCLALRQEKMFRLGLVFFLCGHVFYIFAFLHLTQTNAWTWMGSPVLLAVSGLVYFRLKPHLGPMKTPVLLYLIVITTMVVGAWTVLGDSRLTKVGRIMVFAGALSFYCSDVFVARDRFGQRNFFNRLIGLPMYYVGQFLLAFSAAADW